MGLAARVKTMGLAGLPPPALLLPPPPPPRGWTGLAAGERQHRSCSKPRLLPEPWGAVSARTQSFSVLAFFFFGASSSEVSSESEDEEEASFFVFWAWQNSTCTVRMWIAVPRTEGWAS